MTACMVLTSMNLSALLPWYSQDQSMFTKRVLRCASGLENRDTSVSPMSPSSWLTCMKKQTSAICILLSRYI